MSCFTAFDHSHFFFPGIFMGVFFRFSFLLFFIIALVSFDWFFLCIFSAFWYSFFAALSFFRCSRSTFLWFTFASWGGDPEKLNMKKNKTASIRIRITKPFFIIKIVQFAGGNIQYSRTWYVLSCLSWFHLTIYEISICNNIITSPALLCKLFKKWK